METKLQKLTRDSVSEKKSWRTTVSLIMIIGILLPAAVFAGNYYLDCSAGSNGTGSMASPWNNVASVNNHAPFVAGDTVFVKRGTTCFGELWPKGSGNSSAQIVLCTYGPGTAKPIIDAQGAANSAAIKLDNQEYWTIDGFDVTNNSTSFGYRCGIRVGGNDGQVKHRFRITNNTVRNVYASRSFDNNPNMHNNGGIVVWIDEPGRADDVLIEGNDLHRIVGVGISFWGESEMAGGGMNWNNLSSNVVLRGNTSDSTACAGVLTLGTDNVLVEHNVVGYIGFTGTKDETRYVAGIEVCRHKNGLVQYNEVHHTKKFLADGEGIDNDMYVQGTTIFQYNYTHDNEGGFFLDCPDEDHPDNGKSVLRYNISVNEVGGADRRGTAEYYNNIFYCPGKVIQSNEGSGNTYSNNIFWGSSLSGFDRQILKNNCYHGGATAPTNDVNGIAGNPEFVNPSIEITGLENLDGFKLQPNSPCIGTGVLISDNGGRDFWGNPVSAAAAPNCGADNGTDATIVHPKSPKIGAGLTRSTSVGTILYTMRGQRIGLSGSEIARDRRSGTFVSAPAIKGRQSNKTVFIN